MIRAVHHLIDDASVGGINRMLEHMIADKQLTRNAKHQIVRIKRGQLTAPRLNADIIVSHLSLSWSNLPMLTMLRALHPDTPIIHVEHSYCERFVAAHVTKRDRYQTLMRTCLSLTDHVVAVSREQGAWMERLGFCDGGKTSVIEPCIDLSRYLEVAPRAPGSRIRIGAIGRFDLQKGFDILIDAFRDVKRPDLELHLFGDGPQANELRDRAGACPSIVFHGFAPDVPLAMETCDVIAMPSRWEPFGLVPLEAMAANRPVLATRTDGLVSHIKAGAIDVGGNSAADWTAALEALDMDRARASSDECNTHAAAAPRRFAQAWCDLISSASSGRRDSTQAA